MQRDFQTFRVLGIAPAECHRQLYLACLTGDLGPEPVTLNDFLIGIQHRLCDSHICIVGILDLQPQSAAVAELVERERTEPVRLFPFQCIAEFLYHVCLFIRTGHVAVSVELCHSHRLFHAAVEITEPFEAAFGFLVGVRHSAAAVSSAAVFCHVIGPAPVQCHVLVHRPDVSCGNGLCELGFLFHFLLGEILDAADADNGLHVGSMLLDDTAGTDKKVCHFLIGAAFVEREPVARCLVVDTQEHSAEGLQILADRRQMFIGNVGINGQGQGNVLSVLPDLPHVVERFTVGAAAQSALVGEIVIVWIIPRKADIRAGVYHAGTPRPAFVQRIIAVHQADTAVRSAHFRQNVILIDIFTPFAAVPQINGTLCLAHVNAVNFHVYSPFRQSMLQQHALIFCTFCAIVLGLLYRIPAVLSRDFLRTGIGFS